MTHICKADKVLSFGATHMMHISRMSDLNEFEKRVPKSNLAGGIWISKRKSYF